MAIYRILKKYAFVGILSALVLAMTPSAILAGDGPEPGPPCLQEPCPSYTYSPPPLIGDGIQVELRQTTDCGGYDRDLVINGTVEQVGNSPCQITFENYVLFECAQLISDGYPGISCDDLKPRVFIGNSHEFPAPEGMNIKDCDDWTAEGIEIMAVGNLKCFDDEWGEANNGTARFIFMGWELK